jgi:hypothetical protein
VIAPSVLRARETRVDAHSEASKLVPVIVDALIVDSAIVFGDDKHTDVSVVSMSAITFDAVTIVSPRATNDADDAPATMSAHEYDRRETVVAARKASSLMKQQQQHQSNRQQQQQTQPSHDGVRRDTAAVMARKAAAAAAAVSRTGNAAPARLHSSPVLNTDAKPIDARPFDAVRVLCANALLTCHTTERNTKQDRL